MCCPATTTRLVSLVNAEQRKTNHKLQRCDQQHTASRRQRGKSAQQRGAGASAVREYLRHSEWRRVGAAAGGERRRIAVVIEAAADTLLVCCCCSCENGACLFFRRGMGAIAERGINLN